MNSNSQKLREKIFLEDIAIIVLSVIIAVVLVKTNVLAGILTGAEELALLGSFIAGMFFTSVFTTAPAIAALGEIAGANSIILTALLGAMGAVVGDYIIFRFVKDRFSKHLLEMVKYRGTGKKIKMFFKMKLFRWATFFIGGLILASPLPDELGIGLLGISKMRISSFVLLSFIFNFLGILGIGLVAKAL